MGTLDEISGEIKQKTQGAVQFVQQAEHLFENCFRMVYAFIHKATTPLSFFGLLSTPF